MGEDDLPFFFLSARVLAEGALSPRAALIQRSS